MRHGGGQATDGRQHRPGWVSGAQSDDEQPKICKRTLQQDVLALELECPIKLRRRQECMSFSFYVNKNHYSCT